MKAIQHIKIEKQNIGKLEALDCIRKIERDEDTGEIICYLRSESTFVLPIVREGEYLMQFESKLWQRFGSSAYLALVSNPSEERQGWR